MSLPSSVRDRPGGGLEEDGVGEDARRHEPRQLLAGHDAPLLEHGGDDGGAGAHGLGPHIDGVHGLHVRQAVMVDDGQDLRLAQAIHALDRLAVVHQDHLLPVGPQQVIPGQGAHHLLLAVQYRVAPIAALQRGLPDHVQVVLLVEGGEITGTGDPGHGDGLDHEPGGPVGVVGGGDDDGVAPVRHVLRLELAPAEDDGGSLGAVGGLQDRAVPAGDHDAVLREGLLHAGHRDAELAGEVGHVAVVAPDLSVQTGEQVEQGHVAQHGLLHEPKVVLGDVAGGEHAEELPFLVGDGERRRGQIAVAHELPGPMDRHGVGEDGGPVEVQILHLGAHVVEAHGRLKPEPLQDAAGLVAQHPQAAGHVLPFPQGVAQAGVGDGGHDGVGVRVLVSKDVYGVHEKPSCVSFNTLLYQICHKVQGINGGIQAVETGIRNGVLHPEAVLCAAKG